MSILTTQNKRIESKWSTTNRRWNEESFREVLPRQILRSTRYLPQYNLPRRSVALRWFSLALSSGRNGTRSGTDKGSLGFAAELKLFERLKNSIGNVTSCLRDIWAQDGRFSRPDQNRRRSVRRDTIAALSLKNDWFVQMFGCSGGQDDAKRAHLLRQTYFVWRQPKPAPHVQPVRSMMHRTEDSTESRWTLSLPNDLRWPLSPLF